MIMPNFLILGAPKAGTSSLYRYLKQHPQIYMSPIKEPKFFALEGEEINYQGPRDNVKDYITDLETYRSLFSGVTDEIAIGEASPWYLHMPKSCDRIQHYIPNAKLITILRNPIDRAYSQFLSLIQRDFEPLDDFSQALASEPQRIKQNWSPRWHYKQRGFYCRQLKPYFERFDPQQIKIYLYEDLQKDCKELLIDLFHFLGVNDSFQVDLSRKHNVTRTPRNRSLYQFFRKQNIAKSILRPFFTPKQRTQITSRLIAMSTQPKPPLSRDLREQLVAEYAEDILSLQDLIQRDLSHWLTDGK